MLNELLNRHQRTKKLMKEKGIDGLLILQDVDLFYYTNSMLVIAAYLPVEGDIAVFYKRSEDKIRRDTPLEVNRVTGLKEIPAFLSKSGYVPPKTIGIEADVVPLKLYNRIEKIFTDVKFTDASGIIRSARMIKSEYEAGILKECGKIVNTVYGMVKSFMKEGLTELDVAKEIEYAFRKNDHLGPCRLRGFNMEGYFGHVLCGESALVASPLDLTLGGEGAHPAFSVGPSNRQIKKGEPVIVDYVCNYGGYHVDTTRTYVVGNLKKETQEYYEIAKELYESLIEVLVPGKLLSSIYEEAIEFCRKNNLSSNFMGYKNEQVGFIGHGIGLEVDEYPVIAPGFDIPIEKGMVLALEPKLFFPSFGAVGIEDSFLITEKNALSLSGLDFDVINV
jgi:Xaa-Pro dipeptidase